MRKPGLIFRQLVKAKPGIVVDDQLVTPPWGRSGPAGLGTAAARACFRSSHVFPIVEDRSRVEPVRSTGLEVLSSLGRALCIHRRQQDNLLSGGSITEDHLGARFDQRDQVSYIFKFADLRR